MNKSLLLTTSISGLIIGGVSTYINTNILIQSLPIFLTLLGLGHLYGAYTRYGRKGVYCFLALALFSLIIEYIGTTTCRPYGCFSYTLQLGPEIGGKVPLLLGLIRPVLVLSIRGACSLLSTNRYSQILIGIIGLLLLDLALDPVHVVQGIRDYGIVGQRYNVPRSNYMGRVFSGAISMMICSRFLNNKKTPQALAGGGVFLLCYFWIQFILVVLIP